MGHAELEPEDIDQSVGALHGALKRTFHTFCRTTSIHGLKFAHDNTANFLVRCIWSLITVVMFTCSIVMVIAFYLDYRSNPTRMNVESNFAPISSLLFPAVSICPETLLNTQRSRRFLGTLKLPNQTDPQAILDRMSLLYGFINDDSTFNEQDIALMEQVLQLNQLSLLQFVKGISWRCSDILFRCRFQSDIVDCGKLFQPSRTFYGHCCSFNLNQTGLHFEKHYSRPSFREGLSLILYHNDTEYNQVNSYSHGFHVLIGEQAAFPSAHAVRMFVPLDKEAFVSIRPTETFCSAAVEALSIEERQCVLPHEFRLTYFRLYVGPNCEMNCRVFNSVQYCGCMPYFFVNNRTQDRICSFKDITCLTENFPGIIGRYRSTQCPCPNICKVTQYEAQLTDADLQIGIPTVDKFYDAIEPNYTVIHVFLKSQVYRRVRRDLLSSMVTLVSNLGSAFSLFVGMSMVSLIEIIYYFTVVLHKNYTQEVKAREKMLFQPQAKIEIISEAY